MPTKLRLPKFVPIVRTRVVDLTRRISGKAAPQGLPLISDVPSPDSSADLPVAVTPILTTAVNESAPVLAEAETSEVEFKGRHHDFKGRHHDEIKKSAFGFNMSLSTFERFAREQAPAHAQAGLPRMNAEAPEELPVEAMLRDRASEIFADWKTRSTRKVQDALQDSCLQAGNGVVALRHAIVQALGLLSTKPPSWTLNCKQPAYAETAT